MLGILQNCDFFVRWYIGNKLHLNKKTDIFIQENLLDPNGHFIQVLTHLPIGQNGRYFADDMFKCLFLNENIQISTKNNWNMFLGSKW